MNHIAFKREIRINLDLQQDLMTEIDRDRMEHVILNLLENALNYSPRRGDVFVKLRRYQDSLRFQVKDTGIGITKEESKKIFEKFGKIEHYGKGFDVKTEGCGLGLYISKQIVELHGGRIWHESEGRHKGTVFIVELPRNQDKKITS